MKIGTLALAALALTAVCTQVLAAPVCISTRDIADTSSADGKILTIKLNNGTVMRNRLQGVCSDLKFNGFTWDLFGDSDQVCEGQQSLRVINSGQVCVLGKFDPPVTPRR